MSGECGATRSNRCTRDARRKTSKTTEPTDREGKRQIDEEQRVSSHIYLEGDIFREGLEDPILITEEGPYGDLTRESGDTTVSKVRRNTMSMTEHLDKRCS